MHPEDPFQLPLDGDRACSCHRNRIILAEKDLYCFSQDFPIRLILWIVVMPGPSFPSGAGIFYQKLRRWRPIMKPL